MQSPFTLGSLDPRQHFIPRFDLCTRMCVCVPICIKGKEERDKAKLPGGHEITALLPHFTICQELHYITWIAMCTVALQTHYDVPKRSVLHALKYLWHNSTVD
jgi:hypothetical protein